MADRQDWELWQRTIIEALRPIDPPALFWVALGRIDFTAASDHELDDFPAEEMVAFVNLWLAGVDPEGGETTIEWSGGGVQLQFNARGRSVEVRGWTAMPSLNLLEQPMADIELADGTRRQFTTLTRQEVEQLAAGELRLLDSDSGKRGWFAMLAEETRHFGHETVGDMHPTVITVHAGTLGLVVPPP